MKNMDVTELLVDHEEYQINFLENLNSTFLEFKKKPVDNGLRDAYSKMLEVFSSHHVHKHITNTSLMGVVSIEDQKWVSTEFVPKMKESVSEDLELCIAIILGSDVFSTFGAKNMAKKAQEMSNGLKINFFSNFDEASNWISEQN